jgi:hypothetical protein
MAKPGSAFGETLVFNYLDGSQGSSTGNRTLFVREMSDSSASCDVQVLTREDCSEWKNAAAETFANYEDVWHHSVLLAGEHAARASETIGNFVQNQQCAMPITGGSDPLPIIRRRHDTRAAHRFAQNGGNFPLLLQHILHVISACETATITTTEWAAYGIGRRNMFCARKQRADSTPEKALTTWEIASSVAP